MRSLFVGLVALLAPAIACNAPSLAGDRLGSYEEGQPGFRVLDGGDGGPEGSDLADGGCYQVPDSPVPICVPGPDAQAGQPGQDGPDSDRDGVPDAFDCDPGSSALGGLIVQDDLASAKGLVSPAPGFDTATWTHAGGALRQGAARDQGDLALFGTDVSPNFDATVTSVTTLSPSFNPALHQDFLVIGAALDQGRMNGIGCGVEYVQGLTPSPMSLSIVALSGPANAIVTTRIKNAGRPLLPDNQDFQINVRFSNGTLACSLSLPGAQPLTISAQLGALQGRVGLFTRQNATAFRDARICQVP